ncbi:hypothetical protein SIM91_00590 [Rhodococcus opacus]|uniref:hypothetical protein n=1 Tax=Rhodococcus TaxID=1827 RepID=UPI00135BF8D8|nr:MULTISPECIES: hypothetical protein [Rhodococcus]MDX5961862.1 hypothetical protein [Rhodococcus opacus]
MALPPAWTAFAGDIPSVAAGPGPTAAELAISGTIAVLVVVGGAVVVHHRGDLRSFDLLAGWFGLEKLARVVIATPVLRSAALLARFDDRVVAGTVDAIASVGMTAARTAINRAEWAVDAAVRAIVRGARRSGHLARRPQTGQLHQYYAQAVIGLVVLATLMLALG